MSQTFVSKLEYGQITHSLEGGIQTVDSGGTEVRAILVVDDRAYQVVDAGISVYDITDPDAPSLVGVVTDAVGLIANEAICGLEVDASGRYVYATSGTTSLYTFDLGAAGADKDDPPLIDTLAISAGGNRHVLVRVLAELYILSDSANNLQRIDLASPDNPAVGNTVAFTSTALAVEMGFVDLEEDDITTTFLLLFPSAASTGVNQIGVAQCTVGGAPIEGTPLSLPRQGTASGPRIYVSGGLFFPRHFLVDGDNSRTLWAVCNYEDGSTVQHYFWLVWQRKTITVLGVPTLQGWDTATLLVDAKVGPSAGYIVNPRMRLSDEPTHTAGYGDVVGERLLTLVRDDLSDAPMVAQFWTIDENTYRPVLDDSQVIEGMYAINRVFQVVDPVTEVVYIVGGGPAQGLVSFGIVVWAPQQIISGDLTWVDITAYLRSSAPLKVSYGLSGGGPKDRVGRSGSMSLQLNNFLDSVGAVDQLGAFSPESSNLLSDFVVGAPVRLTLTHDVTERVKFYGVVRTISPFSGKDRDRYCTVTCVDALDTLARAKVKALPIQLDVTASQLVALLINSVETNLVYGDSLEIDETTRSYEVAFDSAKDDVTSFMQELVKICQTDLSYAYSYRGSGGNGSFRFESGDTRHNSPVLSWVMKDMTNLDTTHGNEGLANLIQTKVFPRTLDAANTTVLFTLGSKPRIKTNESTTFKAPYRDPSELGRRVGGLDMQYPVAATDFAFRAQQNGGGGNFNAQLSVYVAFYGSNAEVTVRNNGPNHGYLTFFQLRGQGVYVEEPLTYLKENVLSQFEHGPSELVYELSYEGDLDRAKQVAETLHDAWSEPRTLAKSVDFYPSHSEELAEKFLAYDIGDKVPLGEAANGFTPFLDPGSLWVLGSTEFDGSDDASVAPLAHVFAIHSVDFEMVDGIIKASWGLAPVDATL